MRRRLMAILAADAVGYSRLMSVDDRATVVALESARGVFRAYTLANDGRVIDTAGDSVLAVFETAAGAVSAALEVQRKLSANSSALPEDRRMRFRIGVHLGDVIEKADGTVYGDGVNIAARLEGLAEPGGITVSHSIQSAVKGKISATFHDLGEQTVKNIADPVRAYAVTSAEAKLAAATGVDVSAPVPGFGGRPAIAVLPFTNLSGDSSTRRGPTVAVLPFAYLGDDPAHEYFAEGVVDDIITGLSRVRWLSVVARHSSFVFRGAEVDLARAARELHADYLLHGSFRRSGDRIRVSTHLTEAVGGTVVWAESQERRISEVFDLQDEIAGRVLGAIEPGLRRSEIERIRRKRPEDLDAYDLVLRALPYVYKLMPEGCAPAIPLLQKSLELEPDYALAHATLAWCHHVRFSRGGLATAERHASIRHARAAVALGADDALALAIGAFVLWFDAHEIEAAFDLFDRALSLSPSNVMALATSAVALAWSGRATLAAERALRALQLSPFDALRYLAHQALSGANFQLRNYEHAHVDARRAVESIPGFSVPYAYLCAAQVRLERLDDARDTVRRMLGIDPGFSISRFRVTVGVDESVFDDFAQAWREAGVPD